MQISNCEWRLVPGFGNKYLIRSDGSIKNSITGKLLNPFKTKDGYLAINLSDQNVAKQVKLHRLVAEVFIPNPQRLPVVNHIDGNKGNPHVKNLEWVSYSENSKHAYRTGLSHVSEKCRQAVSKIAAENGKKTTCRPVRQLNDFGGVINKFPSIREAERVTGIPRANIWRACKNPKYNAGGYKWEQGQ